MFSHFPGCRCSLCFGIELINLCILSLKLWVRIIQLLYKFFLVYGINSCTESFLYMHSHFLIKHTLSSRQTGSFIHSFLEDEINQKSFALKMLLSCFFFPSQGCGNHSRWTARTHCESRVCRTSAWRKRENGKNKSLKTKKVYMIHFCVIEFLLPPFTCIITFL